MQLVEEWLDAAVALRRLRMTAAEIAAARGCCSGRLAPQTSHQRREEGLSGSIRSFTLS